MMPGKFITFEGGEGAGKSTQIGRLADRLRATGREVVVTREPGGTPTAESIRRFLLNGLAERLGADGEAILFAAARADHVETLIRPALAAGRWVLCDRFADSTRVYQGGPGGVDDALLDALDKVAIGATRPDLTVLLDVPAGIGLARAARRGEGAAAAPDRFESEAFALHEARRHAYLAIAAAAPRRCVLVDGTGSEDAVADEIWREISSRLLERAA